MKTQFVRRCVVAAFASTVLAVGATPALADVVVADDHIVTGKQCLGAACVDGEVFGSLGLRLKSTDTPGINLVQAGGGFGAQTWDIAGNEANFFVRDVTAGSRLPFRIFPGAVTSSLTVQAAGNVTANTIFKEGVGARTVLGPVDAAATLTALRSLGFQAYRFNTDTGNTPHVGPTPADFNAAFAVGGTDNFVAPSDLAGVALVAVKELDARLTAIGAGTAGPAGPAGTAGPAGPAGPTGTTDPAALAAANVRIKRLELRNRKLAADIALLKKQMRKVLATR